jgi:hypothetical protein
MNSNSSANSLSAGMETSGCHEPADSPASLDTQSSTHVPTCPPASLNDISIDSGTHTPNSTRIPSRLQPVSGEHIEQLLTTDSQKCSRCHRSQPVGRFVLTRVHGKTYRSRQCNQCRAFKTKTSSIISERVAWLAAKKARPCVDCGGTFDSVCMNFHHVRGERKHLIHSAYRWLQLPKLELEVAKCDVVCTNCLRIRTARPPSPPPALADVQPDPADMDLSQSWFNSNAQT